MSIQVSGDDGILSNLSEPKNSKIKHSWNRGLISSINASENDAQCSLNFAQQFSDFNNFEFSIVHLLSDFTNQKGYLGYGTLSGYCQYQVNGKT